MLSGDTTSSFSLKVNGALLHPSAASDLVAATVEEDLSAPAMFTIRLINWDPLRHRVSWSDELLFAIGNQIEIAMGYDGRLEPLVQGEVTGLEPEFRAGEPPMLTVRGYDRSHRLMRGHKTRSFANTSDSAIARQIAAEAGLQIDADDSGVTFTSVLQHNQTDLEFLSARAERINYEFVMRSGTLFFRRRRHNQPPALTLGRDHELLEFYPRLSALGQAGQVAVRGWNPDEKAAMVGQAGIGGEGGVMGDELSGPAVAEGIFGRTGKAVSGLVDLPVASQAEADQIAQARYQMTALSYISGDGVCRGHPELRAGVVVGIEGLGARFSGAYYVTAARHSYSPSQGYRTSFSIRRNAT